jgi:hypothetical protein
MYRIKGILRIRRIGLDVLNLTEIRRNAGHSKWANIKHIKAAKDAQKSLTFQKMAQLIRLAVQGKYNFRSMENAVTIAKVESNFLLQKLTVASIGNAHTADGTVN